MKNTSTKFHGFRLPFIPSGILNIVFQLLEQKRLANEKERVLLPKEMKSFIDSTSEIIQLRFAALGKNKSSPDAPFEF